MKYHVTLLGCLICLLATSCAGNFDTPLVPDEAITSRGFTAQENILKGSWELDTFSLASLNDFMLAIDSIEDADEKASTLGGVTEKITNMQTSGLFELKDDRSCSLTLHMEKDPETAKGIWWLNDAGNQLTMVDGRIRDTFQLKVIELTNEYLTLESGEDDLLIQYWSKK